MMTLIGAVRNENNKRNKVVTGRADVFVSRFEFGELLLRVFRVSSSSVKRHAFEVRSPKIKTCLTYVSS